MSSDPSTSSSPAPLPVSDTEKLRVSLIHQAQNMNLALLYNRILTSDDQISHENLTYTAKSILTSLGQITTDKYFEYRIIEIKKKIIQLILPRKFLTIHEMIIVSLLKELACLDNVFESLVKTLSFLCSISNNTYTDYTRSLVTIIVDTMVLYNIFDKTKFRCFARILKFYQRNFSTDGIALSGLISTMKIDTGIHIKVINICKGIIELLNQVKTTEQTVSSSIVSSIVEAAAARQAQLATSLFRQFLREKQEDSTLTIHRHITTKVGITLETDTSINGVMFKVSTDKKVINLYYSRCKLAKAASEARVAALAAALAAEEEIEADEKTIVETANEAKEAEEKEAEATKEAEAAAAVEVAEASKKTNRIILTGNSYYDNTRDLDMGVIEEVGRYDMVIVFYQEDESTAELESTAEGEDE